MKWLPLKSAAVRPGCWRRTLEEDEALGRSGRSVCYRDSINTWLRRRTMPKSSPPPDLRGRVYRPQGWISPVLLVNGFMHGTWRHEVKGGRVDVTVEPFVEAPAWVRREAEKEAERLAAFFGCPLDFRWKT